jgi:subtilisin family serine protease
MGNRLRFQLVAGLLFILLTFSNAFSYLHEGDTDGKSFQVPSRIIVKFKSIENNSPDTQINDLSKIRGKRELDNKYGVTDTKPLLSEKSALSAEGPLSGIYILVCPEGTDLERAAGEYEKLEDVVYAHPDYVLELYTPPDDSLYGVQWPLNNTGQGYPHVLRNDGPYNDSLITMYGTAGADINQLEVFENPPDNAATVIIAVIDTGVDMDHPELAGKIWQNPGEIDGNGIDDDHNGYVDDIRGWDYTSNAGFPPVPDNDPSDGHGHGTHCSGIIASVADNIEGMTGVVPDCKIMPLKFYPLMLSSYAVSAIIYAADNGADVISMSFGYPWQIGSLEDALAYARSKGVVLCAATGNDGMAMNNYPGSSPNVISVGASTSDDEVAFFSTYGDHMDVVAPGYSVLSLRAEGTDMYAPEEPDVHIIAGNYYIASGTSMACPHAAAAAAYMRSISPGLTPDKVQEILQNTADDILDPYGDGADFPGWDEFSGHGRISLENALAAVPKIHAEITSPLNNEILTGAIDITGTAGGDDFVEYSLEYGAGDNPSSWTLISSSTAPMINGILGTLDNTGLNGKFTIRLSVGEDNFDQVTLTLASDVIGSISDPLDSDTIISQTEIIGSALCPNFLRYKLEYRPVSYPIWSLIEVSRIPVMDGFLGKWQASTLDEGSYFLRLSLFSNSALEAQDSIEVYLRHILTQDGNWKISFTPKLSTVMNYGDFDFDGVNEIVVNTSSGIMFYTAEGVQKTAGMPQVPLYNFRIPPAVGDLNGDGLDDLVAVAKIGSTGRLYVYRSDGQTFETVLPARPDVDRYNAENVHLFPLVFLKDVNDDGEDEIFYFQTPNCWMYDSEGSLIMQIGDNLPEGIRHFISDDSDGDGMDELYSSNRFLKLYDLSGILVDSFDLSMGLVNDCESRGIKAVDIDADGKREIIVYMAMSDTQNSYWVYAFDENLALKDGWPHDTGIDTYLVPPAPIFGDFDGDGIPEYFSAFYELVECMVYGWNIDGSYYIPGSGSPAFAAPDNPGRMTISIMANIDGDYHPELIAEVKRDIFSNYDYQRLMAWDYLGNTLEGWPIVVRDKSQSYTNGGASAVTVGDISGNDRADMVFSTSANELVFLSFDVLHNPNYSPVPIWRYNRKLNNTSNDPVEFGCGDTNGSGSVNISDAVLLINYIFIGGDPPVSPESGDTNCDGDVNISDAVVIINHVFIGGYAPCDTNGDTVPDC